jgi:hypothetical protein
VNDLTPRVSGPPSNGVSEIPQYSLGKILLVWAAAALPMAILGWVGGLVAG